MNVFMKLLLLSAFMALTGGAVTFAHEGYFYPSQWNYRLTVHVQTPQGEVTGSAVRGVIYTRNFFQEFFLSDVLPGANSITIDSVGEAVVIDLPAKGKIFALISDRSYSELFSSYRFKPISEDAHLDEQFEHYNNLPQGQTKSLPIIKWPKIVWFEEIDDPMSLKLVHATTESSGNKIEWIHVDHAAELFGAGYAVTDITIEITDDDVTYGKVEKALSWLHGLNGNYINGKATSAGAPYGLYSGNFVRREK